MYRYVTFLVILDLGLNPSSLGPMGRYIYIYIYIYIYTNFTKPNRYFMSTYFLLDPFEFLYYFYRIRGELIYVLSIVVSIPSTLCPTLGHHQGRIYYKSLYCNKFKTLNLVIRNNSSPSIGVLRKTNVIYKFKCPLRDCISDNNNIYVGLTSTTLSRRLTMHLSDTSSIAQHLKKTFMPNNTITENSHRQHNNIRISK